MKLINSPLSLRNSALSAALIFISTLIYSNISCAGEGQTTQEVIEMMQQRFKIMQQEAGKNEQRIYENSQKTLSEYNKVNVPSLEQEMQRAMQLQQQAQGQFDKDLENARNDYGSKYTRMSDVELRSLMQKGDRKAIAEYTARIQQGARNKLGDSNADILECIKDPESTVESVQQDRPVNLSDKEKSCMQKAANEALMN